MAFTPSLPQETPGSERNKATFCPKHPRSVIICLEQLTIYKAQERRNCPKLKNGFVSFRILASKIRKQQPFSFNEIIRKEKSVPSASPCTSMWRQQLSGHCSSSSTLLLSQSFHQSPRPTDPLLEQPSLQFALSSSLTSF